MVKLLYRCDLITTIDLSFGYPRSRSIFFDNAQWKTLRKIYKLKHYVGEKYNNIFSILNPVIQCYNEKKNHLKRTGSQRTENSKNWKKKYNHVLDAQGHGIR